MDPSTRLSAHFIYREFRLSEKAAALYGFHEVPYPSDWVTPRLLPLVELLEAGRELLGGKPMVVIEAGGYRPLEYDLARIRQCKSHCGIATNSQHHLGMAADIVVLGVPPDKVYQAFLAIAVDPSRKVHIGGLGSYAEFTHVDTRPGHSLARW